MALVKIIKGISEKHVQGMVASYVEKGYEVKGFTIDPDTDKYHVLMVRKD